VLSNSSTCGRYTLASNTIAPQHEGVDLGIGDATLIKAGLYKLKCMPVTCQACI
jgi:hypothetical protein